MEDAAIPVTKKNTTSLPSKLALVLIFCVIIYNTFSWLSVQLASSTLGALCGTIGLVSVAIGALLLHEIYLLAEETLKSTSNILGGARRTKKNELKTAIQANLAKCIKSFQKRYEDRPALAQHQSGQQLNHWYNRNGPYGVVLSANGYRKTQQRNALFWGQRRPYYDLLLRISCVARNRPSLQVYPQRQVDPQTNDVTAPHFFYSTCNIGELKNVQL